MMRGILVAVSFMTFVIAGSASAATLDRIRDTGTFRIGYRIDAPPYSYRSTIEEPAGYSVELCRAVATSLKDQLGLARLSIEYVPVTAENRFDAVSSGAIDLLCGATTATLSRREVVDFSIPTFVDGAGILLLKGGPQSFGELAGKRVGVRAGTTTETSLRNTIRALSIEVETVTVEDHREGVSRLVDGDIAGYFADRAILLFLVLASDRPEAFFLSDRQFTFEPYALVLQKGDGNFRLAVDRALSRIYRSGVIDDVFRSGIGVNANPSDSLRALYRINALPE